MLAQGVRVPLDAIEAWHKQLHLATEGRLFSRIGPLPNWLEGGLQRHAASCSRRAGAATPGLLGWFMSIGGGSSSEINGELSHEQLLELAVLFANIPAREAAATLPSSASVTPSDVAKLQGQWSLVAAFKSSVLREVRSLPAAPTTIVPDVDEWSRRKDDRILELKGADDVPSTAAAGGIVESGRRATARFIEIDRDLWEYDARMATYISDRCALLLRPCVAQLVAYRSLHGANHDVWRSTVDLEHLLAGTDAPTSLESRPRAVPPSSASEAFGRACDTYRAAIVDLERCVVLLRHTKSLADNVSEQLQLLLGIGMRLDHMRDALNGMLKQIAMLDTFNPEEGRKRRSELAVKLHEYGELVMLLLQPMHVAALRPPGDKPHQTVVAQVCHDALRLLSSEVFWAGTDAGAVVRRNLDFVHRLYCDTVELDVVDAVLRTTGSNDDADEEEERNDGGHSSREERNDGGHSSREDGH